ncbi:uncharacterized protein METZ01_LOCUS101288, partial [marine metagenome]
FHVRDFLFNLKYKKGVVVLTLPFSFE